MEPIEIIPRNYWLLAAAVACSPFAALMAGYLIVWGAETSPSAPSHPEQSRFALTDRSDSARHDRLRYDLQVKAYYDYYERAWNRALMVFAVLQSVGFLVGTWSLLNFPRDGSARNVKIFISVVFTLYAAASFIAWMEYAFRHG